MADESTHVDCNRFCGWAKQNCPRVFDGIHYWVIKMLLYRGHSPGTTPEVHSLVMCDVKPRHNIVKSQSRS